LSECETSQKAEHKLILLRPIGPGQAWPVQIGTLWHSAWEVENVLQKYCKQIFAITVHPEFPYCLMGSGTAVKIAERHFLFCCCHQIRDYAPEKIAIPLSFDAKIMSAASMRRLVITDANRDEDTIDVAVFEYSTNAYGLANLSSEFFPTDDLRIWPDGTAKMPFMAFGYPSSRQLYDDVRIGARKIAIQAVFDGATSSQHLLRMKAQKPFDADGMSGGPVFYIGGAPGTYFAGFAGMVMRGGSNSNYLHFMAADFLIHMALHSQTAP
jgi:hypothetical protein